MSDKRVRVLVVDDHEMVRLGLVSFLETEPGLRVVGEANGGDDAVRLALKLCPDVILMDLLMAGMDGIAATKRILQDCPDVKIIVLTSYIEDKLVYPALEAGAIGYLLKTARAEEISKAVFAAANGQSPIDPQVAHKLMDRVYRPRPPHEDLTERELEVLQLIADGRTNQEISDVLHIGLKTVKTHVSSILSKLEVHDRTQAAVYAHRHGIAESGGR